MWFLIKTILKNRFVAFPAQLFFYEILAKMEMYVGLIIYDIAPLSS